MDIVVGQFEQQFPIVILLGDAVDIYKTAIHVERGRGHLPNCSCFIWSSYSLSLPCASGCGLADDATSGETVAIRMALLTCSLADNISSIT